MKSNLKAPLIAIVSLALTCAATAQGKVTDISLRQTNNEAVVHVGGTNIARPSGEWVEGGALFRVSGRLQSKASTQLSKVGPVSAVSYIQVGAFVNVSVRTANKECLAAKVTDGWTITFKAKSESRKPVLSIHHAELPVNVDNLICSLQVSDMEPDKILQTLSKQTHANLVLLSKPDSKLTIRLSQVPLSEMIRHICVMCDLAFLRIGNAYVIATPEKLKKAYPKEWEAANPTQPVIPQAQPDVVTETFDTSHVSAAEIVKALDQIYKDKGLVFVAGPAPMSPEIGAQDGSKATGTTTTILQKAAGGDNGSRMVVMSGERALIASALAMAKQLDKARRQVAIAVTIHDISNDALSDIGINWNFSDVTIKESQPNGFNFGKFSRSPFGISTTLSALVKNGKSKLLASPNISVLDGERAFVLIGDRISYPVLVGYTQNNAPIFSKEEERVGIYLQVSATIGNDGSVTLSLYPQISTVTGFLTVNGASYPQISTREAQTTLRVGTGETIVMGGLFSDEQISSVEKVPFLSQIPFFGSLFQHRKVTKAKSQVIITVTPIVIADTKK